MGVSDRFDEVLTALEREAHDMAGRLDRAQARVRELERTNRTLRAQLADIRRTFEGHTALEETPPDDGDLGLAYVQPSAAPVAEEGAAAAAKSPAAASDPECPDSRECHTGDAEVSKRTSDREERAAASAATASGGSDEGGSATASDTLSPQALLAQWYERYPRTFFKHHTRPLAIGIHESLAAREAAQEKLVRRALAGYVNLPRYLKSVRSGAARIDLDGREVGRVGEDDAQHAREQLKRLQEKQKARETQKQQRRMAKKMAQLVSRNRRSNDAID